MRKAALMPGAAMTRSSHEAGILATIWLAAATGVLRWVAIITAVCWLPLHRASQDPQRSQVDRQV